MANLSIVTRDAKIQKMNYIHFMGRYLSNMSALVKQIKMEIRNGLNYQYL